MIVCIRIFFVNKTFFKSKGRGDERERQQRDQLQNMERRAALSIREADTAEAKLELMDGVINKLKASIKILLSFFMKFFL